ncbi:ArnT family glycosyltransferase [Acidobacteriota bacterium]
MNRKFFSIKRVIHTIFLISYAGFIFLVFKDNIESLKHLKISPLFFLIPLIATALLKILLFVKQRKFQITPQNRMIVFWILIIILFALALRLPVLIHSSGLYTSDAAVIGLMGKHISEGNQPPIFYYGQLYLGSTACFINALFFFLFQYSAFLFKLIDVFIFLGFIVVQFLLMRDIFSDAVARVASIFYGLPIGYLFFISYDYSGFYVPLVLLLGSLHIYISYQIVFNQKENLIPILGFLIGMAFWANQTTIYFILTALVLFFYKFRMQWLKYFKLLMYACLGALPLLVFEVFSSFPTVKFLLSKGEAASWGFKLKTSVILLTDLLTESSSPVKFLFLGLILIGIGVGMYFSLKEKRFSPKSIFGLFTAITLFIYFLSGFSAESVHRYLFPLYFSLPVLLISGFLLIKSRLRIWMMSALILILFLFFNGSQSLNQYREIRGRHIFMNNVIEKMRGTGEKNWQGSYWTSYLLTSLSGEEPIVASYDTRRYFPYRLRYYNEGEFENFIFLRGPGGEEWSIADRIEKALDHLDVTYEKWESESCRLLYRIPAYISNAFIFAEIPPGAPQLSVKDLSTEGGFLTVRFINENPIQNSGHRLRLEIPGYCSLIRGFSNNSERIEFRMPFPKQETFRIKYSLDYRGTPVPDSEQFIDYSPARAELENRRNRVVYLSGFSPPRQIYDLNQRICEKEARIELNSYRKTPVKLRLHLHSPFEFFHPYWYGKYSQQVEILLNDKIFSTAKLMDGKNEISLEIPVDRLKNGTGILTLRFKYHLPFEFDPSWKTAALLEKIELD